MFSNNNTGSALQGLTQRGLIAVASVAAFAVIGLFSTANAAEGIDYNSSRSNKTSGAAAPGGPGSEGSGQGKSSPKLAEAVTKTDEIDALAASISQQMAQLQALCDELNSLSAEVDEEMASGSEASTELLAQLDEAQRIFNEQIATLLDESSIQVVSGDLDKKKKETQLQIESWSFGSSNAGMASSVSPVVDQLSGLQDMFDSFMATCKATGEHIKEAKLFTR